MPLIFRVPSIAAVIKFASIVHLNVTCSWSTSFTQSDCRCICGWYHHGNVKLSFWWNEARWDAFKCGIYQLLICRWTLQVKYRWTVMVWKQFSYVYYVLPCQDRILILAKCAHWPWDNIVTHSDLLWSIIKLLLTREKFARHNSWLHLHCDLNLRDKTLGQGHNTCWSHCVNYFRFNMQVTNYGPDTDFSFVWPWPWRYNFKSRSCHTFMLWTTIVRYVINIKHGSTE